MFHVKHYINKMFHTCFLQDFVFIKNRNTTVCNQRENVSRETFDTNFPIEKNM